MIFSDVTTNSGLSKTRPFHSRHTDREFCFFQTLREYNDSPLSYAQLFRPRDTKVSDEHLILSYIYFTNIIASGAKLRARHSFSLASRFLFAAHQHVSFIFVISCVLLFAAYERYIEVTRRCMHFVSGLFSCVPGKRGK